MFRELTLQDEKYLPSCQKILSEGGRLIFKSLKKKNNSGALGLKKNPKPGRSFKRLPPLFSEWSQSQRRGYTRANQGFVARD